MAFQAKTLDFRFWKPGNIGEQWGIGVHDLDGDGFLDLFVNHHGRAQRELVYGFATDAPRSVELEMTGDLHGASFFDIDQDGDADLLQAAGADRGRATDPDDPVLWSQVNLNEGGVIEEANSVGDFGIEYALGRKRILGSVNLDGEIGLYVGVDSLRPDGLHKGQFFLRDEATGRYEPSSPVGAPLTGEIAKGVHIGADPYVDIVSFDTQAKTLRIYENRGQGFDAGRTLSAGAMQHYDVATGDFDGDLVTEILLARSGKERLYRQDAAGDWSQAAGMPAYKTNTQALAAGDFDNDGTLDYAALKLTQSDGVRVQVYLNRGDGSFEKGWTFSDPTLPGKAEYMVSGDFDRDGSLDLLLTTSYPPSPREGAYVLLEGAAGQGNWLSLGLKGAGADRGGSETGGLGARVYLTTPDGEVQLREQDGGVHVNSQNATDLHFGLGEAETADLRVVWPDGFAQIFVGVKANQHLVLTERREGHERVFEGGAHNDRLKGSALDDLLIGREGFDLLLGQEGDDTLRGGAGNDNLFGGRGDDVLEGGRGADRMLGERGADVFRFAAVTDSLPGDWQDSIRDFEGGRDRIDLAPIDADATRAGNQRFVFLEAADFGGAAGELRFARGFLEADVDGDSRADFRVELRGITALGEGDILL